MVIIVSHVQAHFSHLPAAAYAGRSDQSEVPKHAGKNAARVLPAPSTLNEYYQHIISPSI